jgi:hypothetical protein
MWVAQEAILANANDCICGSWQIELREIMKVAVWLDYKQLFVPKDLYYHEGLWNTSLLWTLEEQSNPLKYPSTPLDILISYTFRRQATDLRDKLYGILGLTKYSRKEKKIPALIEPDYTKPVHRVAQDLTRFMIRESKDLRVLRWIDHGDDVGALLEACS